MNNSSFTQPEFSPRSRPLRIISTKSHFSRKIIFFSFPVIYMVIKVEKPLEISQFCWKLSYKFSRVQDVSFKIFHKDYEVNKDITASQLSIILWFPLFNHNPLRTLSSLIMNSPFSPLFFEVRGPFCFGTLHILHNLIQIVIKLWLELKFSPLNHNF